MYTLYGIDESGSCMIEIALQRCAVPWHRVDARGNKPGVDAQFLPHGPEQLAFAVHPQCGEVDYPHIFAEPDPGVIALLLAPIPTTLDQVLPSLPQGLAS